MTHEEFENTALELEIGNIQCKQMLQLVILTVGLVVNLYSIITRLLLKLFMISLVMS